MVVDILDHHFNYLNLKNVQEKVNFSDVSINQMFVIQILTVLIFHRVDVQQDSLLSKSLIGKFIIKYVKVIWGHS